MDADWMNTGWETARVNNSGSRHESERHISDKGNIRKDRSGTGRTAGERSGRSGTKRSRSDRAGSSRLTKEQRRKKRKRRRIIVTTVIAVLAVALAVVIMMSVLRVRTLRAFDGDYARTVDMTDRIVANAAVWLKDVEGAEVSTEWIRSKTEPLILTATLSFDPQGLKKGSFTEKLDEASYSECSDKAFELTAECLRELIIRRLTMVGYAESVSDEEADALIEEALGMPLEGYIREAGVNIIPDQNELAQELARTGDYRINKMTIEWMRDGEEKADAFRTADNTLIIVEPGIIYTR